MPVIDNPEDAVEFITEIPGSVYLEVDCALIKYMDEWGDPIDTIDAALINAAIPVIDDAVTHTYVLIKIRKAEHDV